MIHLKCYVHKWCDYYYYTRNVSAFLKSPHPFVCFIKKEGERGTEVECFKEVQDCLQTCWFYSRLTGFPFHLRHWLTDMTSGIPFHLSVPHLP